MAQLVRDVMTAAVAAVRPDTSLVEAARVMRTLDVGDVLVADGHRIVGVVSDRDIAVRAVADGIDPVTVSAEAVCTADPVCIDPDAEVSTAVRLMRSHAVRRLPVVEDGRPLGMLRIGDLAVAQDPDSALADISMAEGKA